MFINKAKICTFKSVFQALLRCRNVLLLFGEIQASMQQSHPLTTFTHSVITYLILMLRSVAWTRIILSFTSKSVLNYLNFQNVSADLTAQASHISTTSKYEARVRKKRSKIETHHLSWSSQGSHPVGRWTNEKKIKTKRTLTWWHMLKINNFAVKVTVKSVTLTSRRWNISVQRIISPPLVWQRRNMEVCLKQTL